MKDDLGEQRRVFRWALPGSFGAHLLVGALLIFGLPLPEMATEEEKVIAVDLVPPKQPEEAKGQPPPPAQQSEEAPEQKDETLPPAESGAARRAAAPMLAPVFQFGERDAGPREAVDGNSAKDGSASPETKSEPDEKEIAQPPALAADGPENLALPPGKPEPATEPGQATETQEAPELDEAERLYSQKATGDVTATSAMHDLPRDVRAARLCVTELREQLKNSLPPYFPDLLPSYRLAGGTVLDVRKAAFRTNGRWYDLSYRCEVDTDATKVVSFALSVGAPVPPDEWKRRGLPTQ